MNLIHDIPPQLGESRYRMVVENSRGVAGKFEINKEFGVIEMDRILSVPVPFPFEYGIIPRTWNRADDDPVDIMAVMPISTFSGCLLQVRVVALYKMEDTGREDFKVLAVADGDDTFKNVNDLPDMPTHYLKRIEFFWENYAKLAPDKQTKGLGWSGRGEAETFIQDSLQFYVQKFGKNAE